MRTEVLKCAKHCGEDGYYVLAAKGLLQKDETTDFFIGKEGYAVLEYCFGVPEQEEGRLADADYAEVCLSDYADLLDQCVDE